MEPFEHYIRSGRRLLRCGYTTGTCAALAAQGAARLLLTGAAPETVVLTTPKGWPVEVVPLFCRREGPAACCAVRKDGGDDCDVTDGLPVTATVTKTAAGITIDGGSGVGRVTKPGLDQPVGAAAINHVPRQMIAAAVQAVADGCGYTGGLSVVISIEGGAEAAKRTFNPKLGVEEGLSILGTSGVVEPMSEQAMLDTFQLELRQHAAQGHRRLLLTPGNYGADFLHAKGWDAWQVPLVKCANFIGDTLDMAVGEGYRQILLVGHAGKLVKLAGGVMNTHSRYADCRTELICAHAAVLGAGPALCARLLAAATTDACIELLDEAGLRQAVLARLLAAIDGHLTRRVGPDVTIGCVLFSNVYGLLGMTPAAETLLQEWRH